MHRAKYQPNGGPDGGDGGRGGNIYLRGNHNYWTLLHLRYDRHVFAENGGNGSKCCSHGSDGADRYIDVPPGTVAYDAETGDVIIEQRNRFFEGDELEAVIPYEKSFAFTVHNMRDEDSNPVQSAPHPRQVLRLSIGRELPKLSLLRKKKD